LLHNGKILIITSSLLIKGQW